MKSLKHIWTALLVLSFFPIDIQAQKEDHLWLMNTGWENAVQFDSLGNSHFFTRRSSGGLMKSFINPQVNDALGRHLFTFNGCWVMGADGELLENGDFLSPSEWHKETCWSREHRHIYKEGKIDNYLALPWPGHAGKYYLIQVPWDLDQERNYITDSMFYSIVDMNAGEGAGAVIEKNIFFGDFSDTELLGVDATRHANGRDWWIVYNTPNFNALNVFLLDSTGLQFIRHEDVSSEIISYDFNYNDNWTETYFSNDGKQLCSVLQEDNPKSEYTRLYLFDFERCTGSISNARHVDIPDQSDHDYIHGPIDAAFGPNGRFVYVASKYELLQYDTWEEEYEVILEDYRGQSNWNLLDPRDYWWMDELRLGPDRRMYVSGGNNTKYYHRVDHPHKKGMASLPRLKAIEVEGQLSRLPEMPNYRLGPLDGSPCDTLGLDNLPVAWFRFFQPGSGPEVEFTDLSYYDPQEWQWDFGDGNTSMERYPLHRYDAPGLYTVCLIVSNDNGTSERYCREIEVQTVSTVELDGLRIRYGPNPVRQSLRYEIFGRSGSLSMYLIDPLGNKVWEQAAITAAEGLIPVERYPTGVYTLIIQSGEEVLAPQRIVIAN